jgi:hypothetical protein
VTTSSGTLAYRLELAVNDRRWYSRRCHSKGCHASAPPHCRKDSHVSHRAGRGGTTLPLDVVRLLLAELVPRTRCRHVQSWLRWHQEEQQGERILHECTGLLRYQGRAAVPAPKRACHLHGAVFWWIPPGTAFPWPTPARAMPNLPIP